jgi:hypothetical protein
MIEMGTDTIYTSSLLTTVDERWCRLEEDRHIRKKHVAILIPPAELGNVLKL